jgi:hypothetical protein
MLYSFSVIQNGDWSPFYYHNHKYYDAQGLENIDLDEEDIRNISLLGSIYDLVNAGISSQPLVIGCTDNGVDLFSYILTTEYHEDYKYISTLSPDDRIILWYSGEFPAEAENLIIVDVHPIAIPSVIDPKEEYRLLPMTNLRRFHQEIEELITNADIINHQIGKLNPNYPFGKLSLKSIGLPIEYRKF